MTKGLTFSIISVLTVLIFYAETFAQNEVNYSFRGVSGSNCDTTLTFTLAGIQNGKMLYSTMYEENRVYIGWSDSNRRWELKTTGSVIFFNTTESGLYPPCVGIGEWKALNSMCGSPMRMSASNQYCYPFVYYSASCAGIPGDFFYAGEYNGRYRFTRESSGRRFEIAWQNDGPVSRWAITDKTSRELLFYNSTDTRPLPPDEETGTWIGEGKCKGFSIVGSGGDVLPHDLIAFNIEHRSGAYEAVWSTSREIDVDRFELEYSLDQKNWMPLNSINGQGNATSGMHYYVKFNPIPNKTEFYVRLILYSKDGHFKSFPYVYVQPLELSGPFYFFPNPAHNDLIVEGRIGSMLVIFNSVGQVLLETRLDEAQRVINISSLPKGIYVMEASTGGQKYRQKLVKN